MDQKALKRELATFISGKLPSQGIVALGSGTTVNSIIDQIATTHSSLDFIAASLATSLHLESYQLSEISLSKGLQQGIPLCIDGADHVYVNDGAILKGFGGAFLREKILWQASSDIWICVDDAKLQPKQEYIIPLEILPFSLPAVKKHLKQLSLTSKVRKSLQGNVPFITDNGNVVLDLVGTWGGDELTKLHENLIQFPGILETGIFVPSSSSTWTVFTIGKQGVVSIKLP